MGAAIFYGKCPTAIICLHIGDVSQYSVTPTVVPQRAVGAALPMDAL